MDPTCLTDLSVVNMYTDMISGSKRVAAVVKNLMAIPITITKGTKVIQVVAVNAMPQVEVVPGSLEKLDEVTRMSDKRRREVLFQQLDLSSLERWSKGNQVATHALLAEYHDTMTFSPWNLKSWAVLT